MRILTLPVFVILSISLFLSCEKEPLNAPPEIQVTNATNNNVNIQFPLDSVELTATINDPDDKVVTVHWSKLSGDESLVIENPDLLSTWAKGLKEGTYVIQLKVTDGHGGVANDTITITCSTPELTTTIINPSNNPDEVHLFGNNTTIDQTYPDATELVGGSGTYNGDPVDIRAIFKFDLSNLPENAVVYSAKLTLFSNPTPLNGQNNLANIGTDNSLYIQRITSAWDPTTVNWTHQPTATSTDEVLIPHTDESFLDVADIDVTNLVSTMIADSSNYGFLLRLKTESAYNFRVFCSSKYADSTKHPKLAVSYYTKSE